MILDAQAAQYGLLVQYAMDMSCAALYSPIDPRMEAKYELRGHIIGEDHVYTSTETVCFGFLAERKDAPGNFVAVLRGTFGILEWIEDAEFTLTPHPVAGCVESGFWGVYSGLQFRPIGGELVPLVPGIITAMGSGSVTVVGHSLGSALATYLTLDLARIIPTRVVAYLLATPRPGDSQFADLFKKTVGAYKAYNYDLDLVPRVPRGFNFANLGGAQSISPDLAQARIKFGLGCNHHVLSYVSMLDYTIEDWPRAGFNPSFISCILGPRLAAVMQQQESAA